MEDLRVGYDEVPIVKDMPQGTPGPTRESPVGTMRAELRKARYDKFRSMGKFGNATAEEKAAVAEAHKNAEPRKRRQPKPQAEMLQQELAFVANQTINSANSAYRGKAPAGNMLVPAPAKEAEAKAKRHSTVGQVRLSERASVRVV